MSVFDEKTDNFFIKEVSNVNSDFSRVLTLLRKERNISQKKVAMDLGISQGLLSHYEKGKRECGLDFLVKAANYYDVSCDYLLGRSPEPQGKTISVEDIPDDDSSREQRLRAGGVMVTFNKKLIINSINVLFSLLAKAKSTTLVKEISSYIMLAVYQMIRIVYSCNPKNDENFFTVPKAVAKSTCNSAMCLAKAKSEACVSGVKLNESDSQIDVDELYITTNTLAEDYPIQYSSVVNLIKNSEAKIQLIINSDK